MKREGTTTMTPHAGDRIARRRLLSSAAQAALVPAALALVDSARRASAAPAQPRKVGAAQAGAGGLRLVEGGRSEYRIVIGAAAAPAVRRGARELQSFLKQISGATLPLVTDKQPL